jgi:hypothetical protein
MKSYHSRCTPKLPSASGGRTDGSASRLLARFSAIQPVEIDVDLAPSICSARACSKQGRSRAALWEEEEACPSRASSEASSSIKRSRFRLPGGATTATRKITTTTTPATRVLQMEYTSLCCRGRRTDSCSLRWRLRTVNPTEVRRASSLENHAQQILDRVDRIHTAQCSVVWSLVLEGVRHGWYKSNDKRVPFPFLLP